MKFVQEETALLVVDVQNDFVTGSLACPGALEIIEPINKLAEIFDHVIVIKDWHTADHISFGRTHEVVNDEGFAETRYGLQFAGPDHCVQGTWGAQLAPGLKLDKAEIEFRKGYFDDTDSYGAFHMNDGTPTGFAELLRIRGYKRVFGVGIAKYGCVAATLKGAAREGFEAIMIEDCCRHNWGLRAKTAERAQELDLVAAADLQEAGVTTISSDALLSQAKQSDPALT